MRFSLIHFPRSTGPQEDRWIIDAMTEQSLWADAHGFGAVFLPEHHFTGYSPLSSDPFQYAAYLAPQLRRAHLGMAVAVLPAHHPVRLVEQMNQLDQLTRGRVIFGIGSGGLAEEVIGFGVEVEDQTGGMLAENLDIALRLWAKRREDPPVRFRTAYYKGVVLDRIVPAPYRQPHPLLAGVAMREQSIVRTARNGWPAFLVSFGGYDKVAGRLLAYRRELAAAGHAPEVLARCMDWTTLTLQIVQISDTRERALAELRARLAKLEAHHDRRADLHQRAAEIAGTGTGLRRPDYTSDEYIAQWCVYGTPDEVAEQIRPYADLGIGTVMLSFNNAPYDQEELAATRRSMRLFVDEVMPRFAHLRTPASPQETAIDVPVDTGSPSDRPGVRLA
ncbi:luciferase family protein [Actinobacteria bacterium OK074]|nr:luciferase family protein [Actinobacteria bacterium OK074]